MEKSKIGLGLESDFGNNFALIFFLHQAKIDFLEITSDHYLDANEQKIEELKLLKEHFPLIPHSLELSLGSAEGVDEIYLEKFAEFVELYQSRMV